MIILSYSLIYAPYSHGSNLSEKMDGAETTEKDPKGLDK